LESERLTGFEDPVDASSKSIVMHMAIKGLTPWLRGRYDDMQSAFRKRRAYTFRPWFDEDRGVLLSFSGMGMRELGGDTQRCL
jgi:hypothetical protein